MEVDLPSVGGGNEAVIVLGNDRRDCAVWRGLMRLDLAFELANLILQLAAGGVECVSDGDMSILVPPGCRRVAADVDMLAARHSHVDANAIGIALVVAMLRPCDHHARGGDTIVEAFEPLRFLADGCLERIGMVHVLEDDLKGYLHR